MFAEHDRMHVAFEQGSSLMQTNQYKEALEHFFCAQQLALQLSHDELLGANAQQRYVTTSLIVIGLRFRCREFDAALRNYYQLTHHLDSWQNDGVSHADQRRLRHYQKLAQRACQYLHLERLCTQQMESHHESVRNNNS